MSRSGNAYIELQIKGPNGIVAVRDRASPRSIAAAAQRMRPRKGARAGPTLRVRSRVLRIDPANSLYRPGHEGVPPMIAGIGVDMIPIQRIERLHRRRGARALERIFARVELDYCMELARPAPSLAVRFAAKEAFLKALGTGWPRGGRWTEIRVERSADSGRPTLTLHGSAARLAQNRGINGVHLSLSHTRELGAAFVVLET